LILEFDRCSIFNSAVECVGAGRDGL